MDKDIIDQLFILVIIPVLSAVAAFVIAWLKAKTKELDKRTKEDKIKCSLDMLDKTIEEVVNTISQTSVERLIKQHSESRLSQEDIEEIKLEILKYVYTMLEESQIVLLKSMTSDLDCHICCRIESMLQNIKAEEERKKIEI